MDTVLLLVTVALVMASAVFIYLAIGGQASTAFKDYQEVFTESAQANMSEMFLFVDPGKLFIANAIAMVVFPLMLLILTGDLLISGAVLLVIILLPRMVYRSLRRKRLALFEQQLPDALAMMAGAMRAGASLNIAIEGVVREMPVPIGQEFELFLKEQRLGLDFDVSLSHMERRVPQTDFKLVISALRISREIGGNLTEIMDKLADTIRRKSTMDGKIESLTAQGKMQGIVMAGLPILMGVLLMQIEPEQMSKLFTTEPGWICLAIIIVMEFMGYMAIRKITTIDV